MCDKVPQAINLNTVARDGRVKATYFGFATKASGVFHKELKDDLSSIVDRLLAGEPVQTAALGTR